MAKRNVIANSVKFSVLHKYKFQCVYCGDTQGSKDLEVDHLIPVSLGGSDDEENLVAACKKCNNGKSNRILFPTGWLSDDACSEGFRTWKKFGFWSITVNEEIGELCLECRDAHYHFSLFRCREDWWRHINQKTWAWEQLPGSMIDLDTALKFAHRITADREAA